MLYATLTLAVSVGQYEQGLIGKGVKLKSQQHGAINFMMREEHVLGGMTELHSGRQGEITSY